MIKNPKDIPDILNKHFSTIGKKLASRLPNSNTHFSQYLNSHNYLNSFFFNPLIPSEVEFEITSLPCSPVNLQDLLGPALTNCNIIFFTGKMSGMVS
jgi:hypothetical protein